MNWLELLNTPVWSPLESIFKEPLLIVPRIYRVGVSQYVLAMKHNKNFQLNKPDAPFITMAMWAPTNELAIKALCNTDIIQQPIVIPPPKELLLGTEGRYGQLYKRKRLDGGSMPPNRGVINLDGIFSHSIIDLGLFRYCYFNEEPGHEDLPFAIMIDIELMKYYPKED